MYLNRTGIPTLTDGTSQTFLTLDYKQPWQMMCLQQERVQDKFPICCHPLWPSRLQNESPLFHQSNELSNPIDRENRH